MEKQRQQQLQQKITSFWKDNTEAKIRSHIKKTPTSKIKIKDGNMLFGWTYGIKLYVEPTSDPIKNSWEWYKGDLKNGNANGTGMLKFKDGHILCGLFKNDNINGFAVSMTQDRRRKYVGYWKNNKRDGKGKLYYDGILVFDGNYKSDNETSGKLYRDNGILKYDGHVKNSKYHGKGKLYYPNGNLEYHGSFKSGRFDGKGKLYYSSGRLRYIGEFKNGRYYGKGKLYDENKKLLHEGYFDGYFLGIPNHLSLQQKQTTRRALQDKKIVDFFTLQQSNPREYLKEKGNLLFFNGKNLYGATTKSVSTIYDNNDEPYILVNTTGSGTKLYFTEILQYYIKNGDNFFYFKPKPHHKVLIGNREETINSIYFKNELTQQQ